MFRLFIITLEIFALVAIMRSPFVQYLFSDTQDMVSNWMTDISQLVNEKELVELRNVIAPRMENMSQYQKEYLKDIISSKDKVERFSISYCDKGDKNPYIYGVDLRYFCVEINRLVTKSVEIF
jgi:hypothetical protein